MQRQHFGHHRLVDHCYDLAVLLLEQLAAVGKDQTGHHPSARRQRRGELRPIAGGQLARGVLVVRERPSRARSGDAGGFEQALVVDREQGVDIKRHAVVVILPDHILHRARHELVLGVPVGPQVVHRLCQALCAEGERMAMGDIRRVALADRQIDRAAHIFPHQVVTRFDGDIGIRALEIGDQRLDRLGIDIVFGKPDPQRDRLLGYRRVARRHVGRPGITRDDQAVTGCQQQAAQQDHYAQRSEAAHRTNSAPVLS